MFLRFWTREKIEETRLRGSMAESVEVPVDQMNELLWMAEKYIDIAKPNFQKRIHLTIVET
jgi:hypothetical protein